MRKKNPYFRILEVFRKETLDILGFWTRSGKKHRRFWDFGGGGGQGGRSPNGGRRPPKKIINADPLICTSLSYG